MENNGKVKVYIVVALAFGLLGGYLYGSIISYDRGYSFGYEKARVDIKARLEERRIVQPMPKEVHVVSGTIRSIGDDRFVLESKLPFDPTLPAESQNKTVTKTVIITSATEINIRSVEHNRGIPKPGEPFIPLIIKNTKTDLKSLKVSDAVVVEAEENIIDKDLFEAVSVTKNG